MPDDSAGWAHRSQIWDGASALALGEIPCGGGRGPTSGNRGLTAGLLGILVHD